YRFLSLCKLIAIATKEEVDREFRFVSVIKKLHSFVGGIRHVVNCGSLTSKSVQPLSRRRDKDGINHVRTLMNRLNIARHKQRIDITIGDPNLGDNTTYLRQRRVSNQITVTK